MSQDLINPLSIRDRIVDAACTLLMQAGLDAMSTRAIALAAGVPAPTIFRLFGDKNGLLEALAWRGFNTYLARKVELVVIDDPVERLRRAWDLNISFGLSQPAFYTLVFGQGQPGRLSEAGRAAVDGLHKMVAAVAQAGRLRMSVERATAYMHANGTGTVLSLLSVPEDQRDAGLSEFTREAVLGVITTGTPHGDALTSMPAHLASHASGLREALAQRPATVLTDAERALLDEWLKRLADAL